MLTIGKSNYMRFNHPAEAELIRSTIGSNERISMPQIDFTQDSTSSASSTTSSSSSTSSEDANAGSLLAKKLLGKSEFTNNIMNNNTASSFASHSPKVFAADSVTVNAPAKDVLGAKFNNFTKNLTQMFGKNEKNSQQQQQQHSQRKVNNNAGDTVPEKTAPMDQPQWSVQQQQPQHHTIPAASPSPKIQQFSACYDRYPKPGSYGSLQVFPMNNVNSEMNTEQTNTRSQVVPVAQETTSQSSPNGNGFTELQRQRAQIERMQEQHISQLEHERLEEILKMCADFERQHEMTTPPTSSSLTVQSSPIVQNRIKTNGSLPREKKPSPTAASPSANTSAGSVRRSGYENVHIGADRQVRIGAETGDAAPSNGATTSALMSPFEKAFEQATASPGIARKNHAYVPQSPRTKIRTCVSPKRDAAAAAAASVANKRAEYDALVQSFEEKLRLEIQLLRDNRTTAAETIPTTAAVTATATTTATTTTTTMSQSNRTAEPVYGTLEKRPRNVGLMLVNVAPTVASMVAEPSEQQLRDERLQVLTRVRELRARIAELQRQDEEMRRGVSILIPDITEFRIRNINHTCPHIHSWIWSVRWSVPKWTPSRRTCTIYSATLPLCRRKSSAPKRSAVPTARCRKPNSANSSRPSKANKAKWNSE